MWGGNDVKRESLLSSEAVSSRGFSVRGKRICIDLYVAWYVDARTDFFLLRLWVASLENELRASTLTEAREKLVDSHGKQYSILQNKLKRFQTQNRGLKGQVSALQQDLADVHFTYENQIEAWQMANQGRRRGMLGERIFARKNSSRSTLVTKRMTLMNLMLGHCVGTVSSNWSCKLFLFPALTAADQRHNSQAEDQERENQNLQLKVVQLEENLSTQAASHREAMKEALSEQEVRHQKHLTDLKNELSDLSAQKDFSLKEKDRLQKQCDSVEANCAAELAAARTQEQTARNEVGAMEQQWRESQSLSANLKQQFGLVEQELRSELGSIRAAEELAREALAEKEREWERERDEHTAQQQKTEEEQAEERRQAEAAVSELWESLSAIEAELQRERGEHETKIAEISRERDELRSRVAASDELSGERDELQTRVAEFQTSVDNLKSDHEQQQKQWEREKQQLFEKTAADLEQQRTELLVSSKEREALAESRFEERLAHEKTILESELKFGEAAQQEAANLRAQLEQEIRHVVEESVTQANTERTAQAEAAAHHAGREEILALVDAERAQQAEAMFLLSAERDLAREEVVSLKTEIEQDQNELAEARAAVVSEQAARAEVSRELERRVQAEGSGREEAVATAVAEEQQRLGERLEEEKEKLQASLREQFLRSTGLAKEVDSMREEVMTVRQELESAREELRKAKEQEEKLAAELAEARENAATAAAPAGGPTEADIAAHQLQAVSADCDRLNSEIQTKDQELAEAREQTSFANHYYELAYNQNQELQTSVEQQNALLAQWKEYGQTTEQKREADLRESRNAAAVEERARCEERFSAEMAKFRDETMRETQDLRGKESLETQEGAEQESEKVRVLEGELVSLREELVAQNTRYEALRQSADEEAEKAERAAAVAAAAERGLASERAGLVEERRRFEQELREALKRELDSATDLAGRRAAEGLRKELEGAFAREREEERARAAADAEQRAQQAREEGDALHAQTARQQAETLHTQHAQHAAELKKFDSSLRAQFDKAINAERDRTNDAETRAAALTAEIASVREEAKALTAAAAEAAATDHSRTSNSSNGDYDVSERLRMLVVERDELQEMLAAQEEKCHKIKVASKNLLEENEELKRDKKLTMVPIPDGVKLVMRQLEEKKEELAMLR